MTNQIVYLDHAASTTMRDCARVALLEGFELGPVNASGSHRSARRARDVVDDCRESLGELLGVDPGDIVFTSGGTEGDNLAVLGAAAGRADSAAATGPPICSAIEHPAVLEPCAALGGRLAAVDARGVVRLDQLSELLVAAGGVGAPPVVSIMAVNNEVGSIQPVVEMARLVHDLAPGALVHTDAVQAMGWLDLRTIGPEVDLLTLSAHKFGGPHGVGACVVRKSAAIAPRQLGGGQERDRRSGTLNVASIMAMTAAAVEADALRSVERSRIGALRDRLVDAVIGSVPGAIHTGVPPVGDAAGDRSHLAEGFAHFCFEDLENEALLFLLDEAGISASAASACASGAQHPSHVLDAMGIAGPLAAGSLRLSLGHDTTEVDVDRAVDAVVASVNRLRRYRS